MGQIIATTEMKRAVNANRDAYVAQVSRTYSRLFSRSPTFVTYYQIDPDAGYADINLGGAVNFVGAESPIKFHRIEDFPVYGISEADLSTSLEELEGAVSNNIGGEAFVLPGTIEPNENDVFVIQHLGTPLLFRVKQVDPAYLEGRSFFKVQYLLDNNPPGLLDRQVSGEFAFELRNVGTEFSPVLKADTAQASRELGIVEEAFRVAYWRAFYDRGSGCLVLRGFRDRPIHDRSLDQFVSKNDLLSSDTYLGSRVVRPVHYGDLSSFEDTVYPHTLYGQLDRGLLPIDIPSGIFLASSTPVGPSSPFFADYAIDGLYEAFPGGSEKWPGTAIFDSQPSTPLQVLASRCVTGEFRTGEVTSQLTVLAAAMNDAELLISRSDFFWLGPIVLMESRHLQRSAARTSN